MTLIALSRMLGDSGASQSQGGAMDQMHEPKSEALRALFWRDEILQLIYWLRGEGFGEHLDPPLVERFLGVEAAVAVPYLNQLVDEGLLFRGSDSRYVLTDEGVRYGGHVFAEEFADINRPAHGECGPECWCHASSEEALACVQERHGGAETRR